MKKYGRKLLSAAKPATHRGYEKEGTGRYQ
jgi:hypothetical protein